MAAVKKLEVIISVSGGNIQYAPLECIAHAGDSIVWKCSNGPFAIQFFCVSPVETRGGQSENQEIHKTVQRNVQPGTYQYACAVWVEKEKKVYLDASCPAIIIDFP